MLAARLLIFSKPGNMAFYEDSFLIIYTPFLQVEQAGIPGYSWREKDIV
jgi:hypothetical protein